jgi:ABC-type transport system involved in cytochrome c biogenesis permease subunit
MMTWDIFIYFALPSIACSAIASVLALCGRRKGGTAFSVLSILVLAVFIGGMWLSLKRPTLRTMGETRLWYSFFAGVSGLFTYLRWRYKWILSFSTVLSTVFIILNLAKPEIHDQTLMPALQSGWFIPHVTVYMFSYSLLGCAFLIAVAGLCRRCGPSEDMMSSADTLIYIGTAFLTFGMLSGAIWAKQAWGHFWNWDPKETWALITWLVYLLYMHLRLYRRGNARLLFIIVIFAFACLQMCWWGINFLPSAQGSLHVY